MKKSSRSSPSKEPSYKDIEKKIFKASELPRELKIVLYGRAGTGKTTLACSFPSPILLVDISEKGTDSVRDMKGVHVIRVTEWSELQDLYWLVKKNPDKFKTIIFDTMSHLQDLAIRSLMTAVPSGRVGNWGTMTKAQWGQVSSMLKTVVLDFRDLPNNIVFVAHDRVFNMEEEEGNNDHIDPSVGPRLMPSVASTLNAAVGIIGNTFIKEKVKEVKVGKKTIEKRKMVYCLRLGPNSYYVTKVRKPKDIEVPSVLEDPTYSTIMDAIQG